MYFLVYFVAYSASKNCRPHLLRLAVNIQVCKNHYKIKRQQTHKFANTTFKR